MEKVLMIVMIFFTDGSFKYTYKPFESYKSCWASLDKERSIEFKKSVETDVLHTDRFCVSSKLFEHLLFSPRD
jgi:hypothetical protein